MMWVARLPAVCCLVWLLIPGLVRAASDNPAPSRIDPAGIQGTLVICGGGGTPKEARETFLKSAGGPEAKIVVIPTAGDDKSLDDTSRFLKAWAEEKPASLKLLHTRSRDEANRDEFVTPLKEATAVWFDGGSQSRIADAYLGTAVEKELVNLLQRGGVIGGTSAGAAIMSRVMIARGNPVAEVATGFDFLPGCVIDQHFSERQRKPRLTTVIQEHPGLFGIGIDETTAVIVRGREMQVVGKGAATIILAKSETRQIREIEFKTGEKTDLTRWRNASLARAQAAFPPAQPPEPKIEQGSLVIVGGGGLPKPVIERFIQLAGGPEAKIVVLPTANEPPRRPLALALPNEGNFLTKAGCQNVITLPEHRLDEVSSPEYLDKLKSAQGVWFGGGRQWRFVDAYAGTPAEEALRDVLRRGGVIGGSSAGATIQGDYLVRGSPQGNMEMMAEGYERGFAYLPGVAIDQHFTQRKREADLIGVMKAFPQLLGIGLDEATAIIVTGSTAEVLGKNKVHFFNTRQSDGEGQPERVSLDEGKRYDLIVRKEITDDTKTP